MVRSGRAPPGIHRRGADHGPWVADYGDLPRPGVVAALAFVHRGGVRDLLHHRAGYVTDNTGPSDRAQGLASFLAGFFGGILAERLGYRMTFVVSAGLGLAAALLVSRYLTGARRPAVVGCLRASDFALLLRNRRFVALSLFVAIPSKIALTGFIFYAILLHLRAIETSQGDIGRALVA
jgi:MFS family permease